MVSGDFGGFGGFPFCVGWLGNVGCDEPGDAGRCRAMSRSAEGASSNRGGVIKGEWGIEQPEQPG